MDAVDTALVDIEAGSLDLVEYEQFPLPEEIRTGVRKLSGSSSMDAVTCMDAELGHLFADAVLAIIKQAGIPKESIRAIGSHGQTILHLPQASPPRTLQIGDANTIAHRTGITTVTDFRRLDLAAGGQGAPLAPALHAQYFRSGSADRIILNIGGIANITLLPSSRQQQLLGFDTGPGNGLMDDWNRRHNSTSMDKDGEWAASGMVNQSLLEGLLSDPYFSQTAPKSTGRDYFNLEWLDVKLNKSAPAVSAVDVQATLVLLTARNIADAIKQYAPSTREIYVCGGGIHNPVLMKTLESCVPEGIIIASTESLGIHPDAVEAVTFAWLAHCRMEGIPGNLPSVTGAERPVILGAIYEGSKP